MNALVWYISIAPVCVPWALTVIDSPPLTTSYGTQRVRFLKPEQSRLLGSHFGELVFSPAETAVD